MQVLWIQIQPDPPTTGSAVLVAAQSRW